LSIIKNNRSKKRGLEKENVFARISGSKLELKVAAAQNNAVKPVRVKNNLTEPKHEKKTDKNWEERPGAF